MKRRPKPAKSKSTSNNEKVNDLAPFRENSAEEFLTTNQGLRINDDQNSLKAGERGPSLLEDFLLREKITHFDHERIPERSCSCARRSRARCFSGLRIDGSIHESQVSARSGS